MKKVWICSQAGSREKYAIPRAVQRNGNLADFYTDVWVQPGSLATRLNKRLDGRYHPELRDVNVQHFTWRMMLHKLREKITGSALALDSHYDRCVQKSLLRNKHSGKVIFFGYSYSSRLAIKTARSLGYATILGQINPGPAEAEIVSEAFKSYRDGKYQPTIPGESYWERWREEVEHADRLLVNSAWSRELLVQAGVPAEKCVVIPLAYEREAEMTEVPRSRKSFDHDDPLKLLYLGGIGIRKGFHILVEAMKVLVKHPVHLDVVGGLKGPRDLTQDLPPNITLHGSVPGSDVGNFYRNADVFIFPTLSDGFGLTQLEAQSYKLPMIVSRFCAQVVTNQVNGIILEEVNATCIRDAVIRVIDQPELLERFSFNAVSMNDYSIGKLSQNLSTLE